MAFKKQKKHEDKGQDAKLYEGEAHDMAEIVRAMTCCYRSQVFEISRFMKSDIAIVTDSA